ncbi:MAG: prepilin peptidase [Planctomycetota bacterium]
MMPRQLTSVTGTDNDLLNGTLWGEYLRLLLVGTAVCSAIMWATQLATHPAAVPMVAANVAILCVAISGHSAGLWRFASLSLLMLGISLGLLASNDASVLEGPPMFSPAVTIGALVVLAFRDGLIAMNKGTKSLSLRRFVIMAIVAGAVLYMIAIPIVDAFFEMFRERPQSYTIEELTAFEILRIRSSKFAVFAIFAYCGACIGSFLNVVAASAPLGEQIALRSSACPKCGTPISRIDNLPIISYLRLGGRCRSCDAEIPLRYFVVELIGLTIFATLFLYELVTGAANVPGFQHYSYAGILWIILYTKWPVVGIYFFHCALFSCVLTLALMEQDKLRPPRWMSIALLVIFSVLAIASPNLLTVPFGDQTPIGLPATLPDWIERAATSATGAVFGLAIVSLTKSKILRRRQSSDSLALAFVLIGISLGWQAVLTIAAVWLLSVNVLRRSGWRRVRPRWLTVTTLLFAIAMLHHPAWKWLADRLSF